MCSIDFNKETIWYLIQDDNDYADDNDAGNDDDDADDDEAFGSFATKNTLLLHFRRLTFFKESKTRFYKKKDFRLSVCRNALQ